ncbi:MAG TPA: cation diffusion facilitator family transporter [Myxococcaceae bacterium]|nr:cation diffusion facilitator family transporter [Myxococcaceae bacterium]
MTLRQRRAPSGESTTTVVVALAANLGIAIAKLVAALISGSSAMLAEAFHAMADTGNEVILLVAQRQGALPPDEDHPLGHGRAAYFWALIAALGVFVTGALLSIREGILELLHPAESTSFLVAYIVLAISLVLESISLFRAYQQLRNEATELQRDFREHLRLSSDPIARAVLAEDSAAVAGNLIAGAGIGLRQLTGSSVPDGLAALLIGLILGYVAFELARRNGDFLIGRRAPRNVEADIRKVITSIPGVTGIGELLVIFIGPRQVRVLARVDIEDELGGAQVKALIAQIEDALIKSSPYIVRVDIVPDGRPPPTQEKQPHPVPIPGQ